jgi:hypothetical protein
MDAGTLHEAIAEVGPITSCSVGKSDDRSTWTWEPGSGATQAQIDAGNNVVATIPIDYEPPPKPTPQGTVLYEHENRLRVLEGQPPLNLGDFIAKTKVI